jgi:ribosomal protein S18 acetylase RimI-like enzyme
MSVADAALVADLLNQQHQALIGRDVADADDVGTWLSMPDGDLERDSRLLLDERGRAVASVIVEGRSRTNLVKAFVSLGRHEDRRSVAQVLLRLVDERARVSADATGLTDPTVEIDEVPEGDQDLERELVAAGYRVTRRTVELSRPLSGDLPTVDLPHGIRLVTADLDDQTHLDALAQIEAEAFGDHDGDLVMQRAEIEHLLRNDPKYLPDLQLIAVDQYALMPAGAVGFSFASAMTTEPVATGYVSSLGVRRASRNAGIGRALLLTQLHAFRDHGWQVARLHVQVGNRTGADRLYTSLGMSPVTGFAAWSGSLRLF